jgi:osmotically inducible protein OsmC
MTATSTTPHTNVLYTAKAHTAEGRDGGTSRTDDGRLDLTLTSPGKPGSGTNPEQLFAAGWSTCFIGAMGLAAAKRRIALPAATAIDIEVDLPLTGGEYSLGARFAVNLLSLERDVAQICGPFFNGPSDNGGQFAVHFIHDVTPKATGKRITLEEVAVSSAKDDQITREQFFYAGDR